MPTLYENYITGDDGNWGFYATLNWLGQSFTPGISHILTSVKVLLWRGAAHSPGTIYMEIYKADGDGKPTGSILASGTTDGNTLPTTDAGEWREISLGTGCLVTASQQYVITMRSSSDDSGTGSVRWRVDNSDPTYAGGMRLVTSDEGTTWITDATDDFMFEEWGEPQGSGGGGSIFPSDGVTRVTSLTHRYDRGTHTLELNLGEVVADFGLPEWDSKPKKAIEPTVEEAREAYIESIQGARTDVSYPEMAEEIGLTGPQIAKLGLEIADIRMRRTDLTIQESYARLAEISKILRGLKSFP